MHTVYTVIYAAMTLSLYNSGALGYKLHTFWDNTSAQGNDYSAKHHAVTWSGSRMYVRSIPIDWCEWAWA